MNETNNSQCGVFEAGGEHMLVQPYSVPWLRHDRWGQEGKVITVACGKHHHIHFFHHGSILEHHAGASELPHIGLHHHRAGQDFSWKIIVDHWDLTEKPVGEMDQFLYSFIMQTLNLFFLSHQMYTHVPRKRLWCRKTVVITLYIFILLQILSFIWDVLFSVCIC